MNPRSSLPRTTARSGLRWAAIAAASAGLAALAACGAGTATTPQTGPAPAQPQAAPEQSPEDAVKSYETLTADLLNSKGTNIGGTPVANADQAKKLFAPFTCGEFQEAVGAQVESAKLAMRDYPPGTPAGDQFWRGTGTFKVTTSPVTWKTPDQHGEVTATITGQDVKDKQGRFTLDKQPDGHWQLCPIKTPQ